MELLRATIELTIPLVPWSSEMVEDDEPRALAVHVPALDRRARLRQVAVLAKAAVQRRRVLRHSAEKGGEERGQVRVKEVEAQVVVPLVLALCLDAEFFAGFIVAVCRLQRGGIAGISSRGVSMMLVTAGGSWPVVMS